MTNKFEGKLPETVLQPADEAALWRAELNDTLGLLQDRLNYSRRIDNAVDDAKARFAEVKEQRPLVFLAGVAGTAALAGLLVYGVFKRFSGR